MTIGAVLWSSLRELVVAVGRRLIGWLMRGFARRWASRRISALVVRQSELKRRRAQEWRIRWVEARLFWWRRVHYWVLTNTSSATRARLCECSKLAKKEGIPMDSPDDVEPKRAPRRAA